MTVVVNRVGFRATDAQIVNEFVEARRQLLGLPSASLSAAKRVFHRLRLVHQKQETTRVLTTDFGLVCHGFPPPFFWHHENYDSHMPEVTGWSPAATIPRMQQRPSLLRHSQGRIEHGTLTA